MPGLSGEETARQMRDERRSKTPIVALTANAFEDDRHACLAAGMDDFLVKPLSPDALRAAPDPLDRARLYEARGARQVRLSAALGAPASRRHA